MEHLITGVAPGSPAFRLGIRAGDTLLDINGETLSDPIDYEALSARRHTILHVRKADGRDWHVERINLNGAPLGLSFGESMRITPRLCKNRCLFCFVDQMRPGCRESLYVKDDDWRMSLTMGNFVTLTNVDDAEFARILKRRAGPLYISVHTTDPLLRVRMMRNPNAALLPERLQALRARGVKFHCQIVLCPGINDGAALDKTLADLAALAPAALSAAVVPVGLTRFREGLYPLRTLTREEAAQTLRQCAVWQERCLQTLSRRFVFPSDELFALAGAPIPGEDFYEDFPQLENGVGMLRQFLSGLIAASSAPHGKARPRRVLVPCGVSAAPYWRQWLAAYAPEGVAVTVQPIVNRFFGETVTVTGLLTGGDLLAQLGRPEADEVLLSRVTLRAEGDLFLDDLSIDDFRAALPCPLRLFDGSGAALYEALLGEKELS